MPRTVGIIPTMPNKAVNMMLRKPLAKDQNGTTHGCCWAAAAADGQILSVTKRGLVLLSHPQQLNYDLISPPRLYLKSLAKLTCC